MCVCVCLCLCVCVCVRVCVCVLAYLVFLAHRRVPTKAIHLLQSYFGVCHMLLQFYARMAAIVREHAFVPTGMSTCVLVTLSFILPHFGMCTQISIL